MPVLKSSHLFTVWRNAAVSHGSTCLNVVVRKIPKDDLLIVVVAWVCLAYIAALFVGCIVAVWYLVTHIPH